MQTTAGPWPSALYPLHLPTSAGSLMPAPLSYAVHFGVNKDCTPDHPLEVWGRSRIPNKKQSLQRAQSKSGIYRSFFPRIRR